MHVFDWLRETNPGKKGITREEKAKLVELRTRVCQAAYTKIAHLNNAKCRGSIGKDLIERMHYATKKEKLKVSLDDTK